MSLTNDQLELRYLLILDFSTHGVRGDIRSCIIFSGMGIKLGVYRFYLWPSILYKVMKYCPSEHFGKVVWSQQDRYHVIMSMTNIGWKASLDLDVLLTDLQKEVSDLSSCFSGMGLILGVLLFYWFLIIEILPYFWSIVSGLSLCVQACLTAWV